MALFDMSSIMGTSPRWQPQPEHSLRSARISITPGTDFPAGCRSRRRRSFATTIFVQHRRRGRGAAARCAELTDADQAVEVANPAGRFDLHPGGDMSTHEFQIVLGRALVIITALGLF